MVVSLIVMNSDGSRSLRVTNSLRCFTGIFTELSDSELSNSTVTGVTYLSLMNLISAAMEIWRSYVCVRGGGGGGVGGYVEFLLNWSFLVVGRVSSGWRGYDRR